MTRFSTGRLPVLAIDGPVGVGKSSIAREAARQLGFLFLDTGAMYRAVAWAALQLPEAERTPEAIERLAQSLRIEIRPDGSIFIDGKDASAAIRTEEVSRHVHLAADHQGVRRALVAQQRRIGSTQPSVLEGRDIATVVFPDARWKVYLDASAGERARRRVAQLDAAGQNPDPGAVLRNLIERDARDRSRPWGALTIADDATILDSTGLDEATVLGLVVALVRAGESSAA